MPFPASWPPRPASGLHSIRFYATGIATANFSDNAFMFIDGAGANPFTPLPEVTGGSTTVPLTPSGTGVASGGTPAPQIWAQTIRVVSTGDVEISFDGTNVHGKILAAEGMVIYRNRFESGIAIRGAGTFRIEAW
jgi:hypothetical protein